MRRQGRWLGLLACLLLASFVLVSCGDDDDGDEDDDGNGQVEPTTGSLALAVSPREATVIVSGPGNFGFRDAGQASYTLDELEPGAYTVDVEAPGFVAQRSTTGVVAGETTRLAFALIAEPVTGRPALYINNAGELVAIPDEALNRPGSFVFSAWLADRERGIATDPIAGTPSAAEQSETAPSGTQNLAAAFVGFRSEGTIFPVVNAAVRWEIDRQFADAEGSLQFGAADDGSNASGADPQFISDDQADTFTNNGAVRNRSRFPVSATSRLYNVTGIETPDTNGFTWVTLFSPDPFARARLVVVASVNGTEIGKQLLTKTFAPRPELAIRKTVEPQTVILPDGETARVTFTVVVTNEGVVDVVNVVHRDRLTTGPLAGYTIDVTTLPEDSQPVNQGGDRNVEGFDLTIASLPAGASRPLTFQAIVSTEAPQYCNTISIASFATAVGPANDEDIPPPAEACFNVIGPRLEIVKAFLDAEGNERESVTVRANEAARVRVRLINSGTAPATGVRLRDVLSEVDRGGDAATYSVRNLPANATPNEDGGFDLNIGRIPVGETVTLTFNARAGVDGRYCDTASFDSPTAGTGANDACLTVATPALTIAKSNGPIRPNGNYQSTITVTNVGDIAVSEVILSDRIGLRNGTTADFVEYVSSSLDGLAGTFNAATNTVTFAPVVLPRAASVTATVTSRIPPIGARAGEYCDTASYTSANAGSDTEDACVTLVAFSSTQVSFVDQPDPVRGNRPLEFNGTIFNEILSNEPLDDNSLVFRLGGGRLTIESTQVFFDSDPLVNPETGLVISGPADGVELVEGQGYRRTAGPQGEETIVVTEPLQPGQAIYTVHRVRTPSVPQETVLTSNFTWNSVGQISRSPKVREAGAETVVLP